jgi:chorismate synthase
MKNTIGSALTVTLFGESHGEAIGAVIDGLSPGIEVDMDYIRSKLAKRRPYGSIATKRREPDEPEFLSGVFNGYTTGTPLTLVIRNCDTKSEHYEDIKKMPRPSHADLTSWYKYAGFQDYRGGGHFSGRITAALVAAGAIVMKALEKKNIYIGTHIKNCHGIEDREFENYKKDILTLADMNFPVLDETQAIAMEKEIAAAASEGDSVGGILETAVINMLPGVGEPWFDTIEGMLSHSIFSIPAVKGIEFGAGFKVAMRDLEIRGAGNMLGTAQHGHMMNVGYELYCKMIDNAVRALQGEIINEDKEEASIEFPVSAYIPKQYIENESLKLSMYKKIASVRSEEDEDEIIDEMLDRFGDVPQAAINLVKVSHARFLAGELSIVRIHPEAKETVPAQKLTVKDNAAVKLVFDFAEKNPLSGYALFNLTEKFGRKVFVHGGTQPFIRLSTDRTHMLSDSIELLETLYEDKKTAGVQK